MITLPLDSESATLEQVGGKGANLALLKRSGFLVPPGFLITTEAYRIFATANDLNDRIRAKLNSLAGKDADTIQEASDAIRAWFAGGQLPNELASALLEAYTALGNPAVAVRSSATAEDLPDLSFAGQQDTYLNIIGPDALLKAVINCWSSLWTARAIGYRIRNRIADSDLALAVVVQHMVESDASGVMFTANPLTGLRSETVIDATLGLGEALVSGQVEPDHYVVETRRSAITAKTLGKKELSVRGISGGGVVTTKEHAESWQALPDEQIIALVQIGQRVTALYNFPQDIEWAWYGGNLYLLQSRPITSLFPVPAGTPPGELMVFLSFAAVQGMLDPMTPLGRDALRGIFSVGANMMGYPATSETQNALFTAGERLWINLTPLMRNSLGRRITRGALAFVEPTVRQAIDGLWDDPHLRPGKSGVSFKAIRHLGRFFLPLAGNVVLNLLSPEARRDRILTNGEDLLEQMRSDINAINGDLWAKLAQRVNLFDELDARHLPQTLILYISGVASGMASFNWLNMLSCALPEGPADGSHSTWRDLVLEVTRGLPHNPTTQMDLDLWKTAQEIRQNTLSREIFQSSPVYELVAQFQAGALPKAAQKPIEQFIEKYGGRGLAEIDIGRPRWREDPTHVFQVIASFLQIEDNQQAPDVVFARSASTAEQSIDTLVSAVNKTRAGWLKAKLVKLIARRVRALMGIRESPKFFAVRMMALIRDEILKSGGEFVQIGLLDQPDDLFYLSFAEIRAFARREERDWRSLISDRRTAYQRELLRRQIPRLLLSDGRAFYTGIVAPAGSNNEMLVGNPVSPGSAEGLVHVIADPRGARLLPGEILVCRGTDPSWTPLFLTAAGLVMEVGGMMTHGAVVAREYGIPAVVGVDQATTRLKTGQRIRLDGSTGQISIIAS